MTIRRRLIDTFIIICFLVFLGWSFARFLGMSADLMYRSVTTARVVNIGEVEVAQKAAIMARRFHTGYSIAIIIATVIAGWLLTRRIVGGCRALQKGADEFAQGNLAYRVTWPEKDEFGQLASHFNDMARNLAEAQEEVKRQQDLAESLLLNILPIEVARELKQKGAVDPRYHDNVTIVFTDFQGFTRSSESLAAGDLVAALHDYFTAFDRITEQYGLEKLKTIGDSYMCVAGLTEQRASHAVDALLAAFEMLDEVIRRQQGPSPSWSIRIGVHTGPVISGVVGIRKFAYDIWGESVNYASRMESSGYPNRINLSSSTYMKVKDFFACESRGKVPTKEGRDYEMYFATGILPSLMGSETPVSFASRYRSYFHRDAPGLGNSVGFTPAVSAAND